MIATKHPLWLGSAAPVTHARAVWGPNCDRRLWALVVEEGRPLVLIGRNSGSAGRAGAREAAKNLHEAARGLNLRTGFDVTALLPSIEELVELLMASANVVKSRDENGREFKNRFCLLDFAAHGLIVSLSTGSAYKVDEDLNQPHVQWIQRLMRELSPAGFFASQFNRVSRVMWQTGLLIEELRALERRAGSMWAADDQYGEWSTADDAVLMHAIRGQQASVEAKEFRRKGTQAQITQSGSTLVDGQVDFALGTGIPPGLFVYRNRRTGRMVLSIDSPGFYPDEEDATYGLPRVVDANGELVDQAETVRWFLREYARPGVLLSDVFRGLMRRRYSTQWLRNLHDQGPSAFYGGDAKPVESDGDACQSWTRGIFSNLAFYETGVLVRTVGSLTGEAIVVSDVFPDAGSWAEPSVFEAIRAKLADREKRGEALRRWSWSGMPVVVDGVPGELRPRQVNSGDEVAWHAWTGAAADGSLAMGGEEEVGERDAETGPHGQGVVQSETQEGSRGPKAPRAHTVPAIPDKLLTASIVKALVAADGSPLTPHLSAEPIADEADDARRGLMQSKSAVVSMEAVLNRLYETVTGGHVNGALLARVQADYDETEAALGDLRVKVEAEQRRVDALASVRAGVSVTCMAALVTGLRDPGTNRYRTDLRAAVTGLTVTSERVEFSKWSGTRSKVAGLLVFDVDGSAFELPFGFVHEVGRVFEVNDLALLALKDVRAGIVRGRADDTAAARVTFHRLASLMGVSTRAFAVSACHDPRLLRLGMAVLFPSPAPGEDPADVVSLETLLCDPDLVDDFGDVAALAQRIETVYAAYKGHRWLRLPSALTETTALIKVATMGGKGAFVEPGERVAVKRMRDKMRTTRRLDRWFFAKGMWPTLSPCRFCGSTAAGAMRIGEITGYLCLNATCRRDEAGVRWPSRFDQYISHPTAWLNAGIELHLPEGFTGESNTFRGAPVAPTAAKTQWRGLRDLDDTERAAIVAAYLDRATVIKNLMMTYRVHPRTLYAVLAEAGVARRHPRGNPVSHNA